VADFIGNVNLLDGKLSVDEADRCAAQPPSARSMWAMASAAHWACRWRSQCGLRKISIGKVAPSGLSRNLFNGKVKEIAYFGSYNTYIVVTPHGQAHEDHRAKRSRTNMLDITWDDEVFFWWDDTDAVLLRD
jgi:putrescine transport system ATP-binding protein